ncbi:MAG: CoA-binding protein [Peptococcaceae bacterium]|nr:CoA-binding protein [Peptococcaceae bacterium]
MNKEDLERMRGMFYPGSVAVLGATDAPEKVGYNLLESIIYGGFKGEVYPVHPRLKSILGMRVYRSLEEIPGPVDLAVVGLNQHATVEAVELCGRMGVKGAVCVAGGFRETGEEGLSLEKRLVEASRKYGIKVIGPNTLGMINTDACLDASFYPLRLKKGNVSFVSQSGGIGLNIIQKSMDEGLGINKWVGVGNRTVLEIADYLEYLAEDPGTKVIGVFLEGVDDARRLVQVAGEVARRKPVVVYKVGRSGAVNYAALTHTGSMAGPHQLFRDIFRQFGVMMVDSVPELVAACKALSLCPLPAGGRVGMYTYTAGPSIAALDQLARREITVPPFSPDTIKKIRGILGENPPVVLKNPLDAAGLGFMAETYGQLVEAVLDDYNVDLLITFSCIQKNWRNPTRELIGAKKKTDKPVLACYISTVAGVAEDREALQEAGIPLYISPDEAAWGAAALLHYGLLSPRQGFCGGGESREGF